MTRMTERERSLWVAALARRIRRLVGSGRPGRPHADRAGPHPAPEAPPAAAKEGR